MWGNQKLMRNRAGTFFVERLIEFLTALGQDVEITLKPTRKEHGEVSVVACVARCNAAHAGNTKLGGALGVPISANVSNMPFQRDNHYVSCVYLKHFAVPSNRVLTYRILVAHPRAPLWADKAIKGVAYHAHLYTRIAAGVESDEVERWLNAEFEAPAEDALRKASAGVRLSRAEWHDLIRFTAAQDVRTPARLMENVVRWNKNIPAMLNDVLQRTVRQLEQAKKSGRPMPRIESPNSDYIPMRTSTKIEAGQQFGTVKSEIVIGRGLWLFSIRHALTKTVRALLQHCWWILKPADGLTWFTSDDPVIRLNYYRDGRYDFHGGWGRRGTEILLPLDPHHLLYTKIGDARRPLGGSPLTRTQTDMIRRFIAEHAHRFIFAAAPDAEVPKLRPRKVDAALVRSEQEQWKKWHEEQLMAERDLMAGR